MEEKAGGAISPRGVDFGQWYQDVIAAADLAEHSGVKGSMIIKPNGYAIWERLQGVLDDRIKGAGIRNAYFPLLIPEHYFAREKEHIAGFAPELAVVTHAGGAKLAEPLVVRPTSETIINAAFGRWIQSWRDLPLKINQWANVVRWELRPRLFLRTTEFLWQEGHTAHATEAEAETQAREILDMYADICRNFLAMPTLAGQKTEAEKFSGALRSYGVEAMMQDGKALQAGTAHNLGQNFARVFDVQFVNPAGNRDFVWQTSWGVSTRLIGGLIMTHGDDIGLVLPPAVAPTQAVIVPIGAGDAWQPALAAAAKLCQELVKAGVRAHLDDRTTYTPGFKFNDWEKKGIPLRLELGSRDLDKNQVVCVRRDTNAKVPVGLNGLSTALEDILAAIQNGLLARAEQFRADHTFDVATPAEFRAHIEQGFVRAGWCGSAECEATIAAETKATIRILPFESSPVKSCVHCGRAAAHTAIFARAY